jgi:hypothetical protein
MNRKKLEDGEHKRPDVRAVDILDPNNQIGMRLRSLYAAVQEEAIPERFLDLLERLDRAEQMAAKVGE